MGSWTSTVHLFATLGTLDLLDEDGCPSFGELAMMFGRGPCIIVNRQWPTDDTLPTVREQYLYYAELELSGNNHAWDFHDKY